MGEILPVWIDGKTNPSDVGTKAQANAPMTENMLSTLTGLQEIPLPEGTQILFGPASNPVMRGNKPAGTVKISRRHKSREQQHADTHRRCSVTHPCVRSLHREDTVHRAAVGTIKKHVAPRNLSAPAEGNAPGQHDLAYNIAAGDHFYTLNDDVVVGWKKSVSPPLDNNGLPLVDVTIASSLFHNKCL